MHEYMQIFFSPPQWSVHLMYLVILHVSKTITTSKYASKIINRTNMGYKLDSKRAVSAILKLALTSPQVYQVQNGHTLKTNLKTNMAVLHTVSLVE